MHPERALCTTSAVPIVLALVLGQHAFVAGEGGLVLMDSRPDHGGARGPMVRKRAHGGRLALVQSALGDPGFGLQRLVVRAVPWPRPVVRARALLAPRVARGAARNGVRASLAARGFGSPVVAGPLRAVGRGLRAATVGRNPLRAGRLRCTARDAIFAQMLRRSHPHSMLAIAALASLLPSLLANAGASWARLLWRLAAILVTLALLVYERAWIQAGQKVPLS